MSARKLNGKLSKTQREAVRRLQRQALIRKAKKLLVHMDLGFVGDAARHGKLVDQVSELRELFGLEP